MPRCGIGVADGSQTGALEWVQVNSDNQQQRNETNMFSLIITIISIALVAALAVASVYYGGNAFQQGTAKAQASTLVAQAQQIAAANTLYANDHAGVRADDSVDAVAVLVSEGYLAAAPQANADVVGAAAWQADQLTGLVTIDLVDTAIEVAKQVNKSIGAAETPAQNDLSDPATLPQYGVVDIDGNGDLVFFYKG